jgi:hypothetical protein
MTQATRFLRQYPWVVAATLVGILGVVAHLGIGEQVARWLGIIIGVGLMVIAAAGFLPAIVGALLQEVVDLVAILGALRAIRDARPRTKRRAVDSTSVQRARI